MADTEIWVLSARVVVATTKRNKNATNAYAKQALKSTFKGLKNAVAAIAIYDEDDNLVGMDVTGSPNEEMRRVMDFEFSEDDTSPPAPQVAGL